MDKEKKQQLYISPKVKVIEVKARQVMCESVSFGADVEQEKLEGYTNFEW